MISFFLPLGFFTSPNQQVIAVEMSPIQNAISISDTNEIGNLIDESKAINHDSLVAFAVLTDFKDVKRATINIRTGTT